MISLRPILLLMLAALLAPLSALAQQPAPASGPRVALVIGNAAYRNTQVLPNPGNDAEDVGRILEGMGFAVTVARDLDRAAMNRAIRDFGERAQGASVALLFYAGHGMQLPRGVSGENFLVPIDARLADIRDVDEEAIALSRVLERLDGAVSRIIILDACRDNPLAAQMRGQTATRSAGRGLARVENADPGTLLVYSTDPGSVALDGAGRNSPFASALVEHMATPALDVRLMLTRVRASVLNQTQGRQRPWSTDGLVQEVLLRPTEPTRTLPAPGLLDPLAAELAFWDSVKDSTDARELEAYVEAFPQGRFVALARTRIERIRSAAGPGPVTAAAGAGTAPPQPPQPPITRVIARPGLPGFTADPSGCRLWNPSPHRDETVVWSGACRDGLAEGEGSGEWRWSDGAARFAGTLVAGRLHGGGRFEWPGGERYDGAFLEGARTGRGTYTWPNGMRYEGDFADGLPHGSGLLRLPDGARYEGEFLRGARTGTARLALPNGDRYEGAFVDGQRTGAGVYVWTNGDRFEGHFSNGVPAGRGVFRFANGNRYEGDFRDGRRTGQGLFIWTDGARYEGAFAQGARTGRGVYAWPTGDRYEGEFLNGVMNGPGLYVFASGQRYEGSFRNGRAVGAGTVTEANGQRFQVQAQDGCVRWGNNGRMQFGRSAQECGGVR